MTALVIVALVVVAVVLLLVFLVRLSSVKKLSDETKSHIKEVVKTRLPRAYDVQLGRVTLLRRHCGQRMVTAWPQERTSYSAKHGPQPRDMYLFPHKVCVQRDCGYAGI
jgi:hypothetical protein